MSFRDRTVLVTGGAMGIGAATVRRLAAEGAHVILADLNDSAAEKVVQATCQSGGLVEFQHVDVADPDSIAAMGEAVLGKWDCLHGLVNNAGIVRVASIEDTDEEVWNSQININLRAPLLCAKALLPALKRGPGHVVNMSSMGGFRWRPDNVVYDATKAGICAMTRTMACEFAAHGMRVNSVAPGWIVTEMHFGTGPDAAKRKAELEKYEFEFAMMRRLGRPEEIAAAIVFLLSDDASYITGSTIHVDGGLVGN